MIAKIKKILGIGGHVAAGKMIAYLDRELCARQSRRVKEHLGGCETCRKALQAIQLNLDAWERATAPPLPAPPVLLEGRERLLRAMRDWSSLQTAADGMSSLARAAEELSVFSRSSGDYLRLHGDSASARRALTDIEPVLAAFLGRAPASSLRSLVAAILPPVVDPLATEAV